MKRFKTIIGLFVCLGSPLLAPGGAHVTDDDAPPLVVDDDKLDCPNADFTTIQAAVDTASPDATIHVCAGIYHERVTITKSGLQLLARGPRGGAVVDGDLIGVAAFWVQGASHVRIEGFTVREGHEADILLDGASNARIRENLMTAAGHDGIELFNSRDNVVEYNVAVNNLAFNACGINVAGPNSAGNVVRYNLVVNNEWGIQITGSAANNVIFRNRAIGNRGNGIRNVGGASGTLIVGNRAFSNGFDPDPLTTMTTNAGIRIGSGAGIVVARNHAFDNVTVDLRKDAAATATFEENRCNTSSPSGLCVQDSNDKDDDKEEE